MRHAPERFVQMGNADWFDHHGFEEAGKKEGAEASTLELRVNRELARYEFMEPVWIELKLTNVAAHQPQLVDANALDADSLTIVPLKKDRAAARQLAPRSGRSAWSPKTTVLQPGESLYGTVLVSAGLNGWDVAEPGHYTVQVALPLRRGGRGLDPAARSRSRRRAGYEDERMAQDLFTDDVGRVLAFDGTPRARRPANDVLRDAAEHLPDRAIARHALVALNRPLMREGKVLDIPVSRPVPMQSAAEMGGAIAVAKAKPDEARTGLETALLEAPDKAARTLGHIDYKQYVDRLTDELADQGDRKGAVQAQTALQETLKARKVLPTVLAQVEAKLASLTA